MSDEIKHGNVAGHGDYERQDISAKAIIYFLVILGVGVILSHFFLAGVYDVLDKRERASQPAVSPLATNVPTDTRQLPEQFRGPKGYEEYLKQNFPAPQLETDERTQLNGVVLSQEDTLNSYGWIDQQAGTVHIPIERAMDLLAQRGLPVADQAAKSSTTTMESKPATQGKKKKK
jgi:hypothetical protein